MGLLFLYKELHTGDSHFLLILLLVLAIQLVLLFIHRRKTEGRKWKRRLPPGPMRLPLIGHLHLLNDLPHRSLQRLSDKYGSIMFLQLGSIPTLVVSSADIAKEIFRAHDIVFSGRPVLYSAKKLSYGCLDMVFAPYGSYWREIRKLAVLELLSVKRVQSFAPVRKEEVSLMIDSIANSSVSVNLSEMMLRLANNTICRVAFGRKYDVELGSHKGGFEEIFQETQDLLGGFSIADFFPWLGWIHKLDGLKAKLEYNFQQLDKFYDKVIEEHLDPTRPDRKVEDFVDILLKGQRDPSHRITLGRIQIKALLMDILIAGTDTTAATVIWTMTELIRNPTKMKRAQEEVKQVTGRKEMVEESDLPQLNYLKLVVKEAMRLHPPVPLLVPRETTENCTVKGYDIPAKTRVLINAKAIMTDPRSWENPEEFCPERFRDNPVEFNGKDFELIPFGAGRRGCPGINFAAVLTELILANLLHCFNWELPYGVKKEDVDMKESFGITIHKKTPLLLMATTAKNGHE